MDSPPKVGVAANACTPLVGVDAVPGVTAIDTTVDAGVTGSCPPPPQAASKLLNNNAMNQGKRLKGPLIFSFHVPRFCDKSPLLLPTDKRRRHKPFFFISASTFLRRLSFECALNRVCTPGNPGREEMRERDLKKSLNETRNVPPRGWVDSIIDKAQ